MNKNTKIVFTLLALGLVFACKESAASEEANYAEEAATDSTSVVSSSAAVENKNSNRKFVRTADENLKSRMSPNRLMRLKMQLRNLVDL